MKTTNHKYRSGDIVKVFEDSITKERPEGKAKVIKCCKTDDYYYVQFLDEPSRFYYRFVY